MLKINFRMTFLNNPEQLFEITFRRNVVHNPIDYFLTLSLSLACLSRSQRLLRSILNK